MGSSVSLAVQLLEALVTEILLAVSVVDLRLLNGARGAERTARGAARRVLAPRPFTVLVQVVEARVAERHDALVALQGRLHHATVLARYLQVRKILVEDLRGLVELQRV